MSFFRELRFPDFQMRFFWSLEMSRIQMRFFQVFDFPKIQLRFFWVSQFPKFQMRFFWDSKKSIFQMRFFWKTDSADFQLRFFWISHFFKTDKTTMILGAILIPKTLRIAGLVASLLQPGQQTAVHRRNAGTFRQPTKNRPKISL